MKLHIKPNSCIDPTKTKSVFKAFLHQAHKICSEKYIKEETQFLIDIFVESGHKRTFLKNLIKDYNVKKKNINSCNYTNSKKIPWVSNTGVKIMKQFKKVNKDFTFTSGKNLQSILYQNKPKLLPNSHPGVHHDWIVHAMVYILANQRKKY